ncbi:unnamed protein product [Hanseniaspora opuntiae]
MLRALSKFSINQSTIMFEDDPDSSMNSAIELSDENEDDSENEYIEGYKYEHKNLMTMDPKPIPERKSAFIDTAPILINNESVSSVVAYSAFKSGGNTVSVLSISPEDNSYNVHSFTRRRSSVSKMPMSKPLSAFKVVNLDAEDDEMLEIHEDMHNEDLWPNFASYLSTDMKDFLSGLLNRDANLRWDVDSYWDERVLSREEIKKLKSDKKKKKKNKATNQKTSYYKQHNIFRNLSWDKLSKAEYQKESFGPIVPIITDKNLAENFDDEFTTKNIDELLSINSVEKILDVSLEEQERLFQGFSYEADSEFLEKYMDNYRTV